jgi:hypothetical protein
MTRIIVLAVALLSLPALADEPLRVEIRVGEEKPLCHGGMCHAPICDDSSVAKVSADGRAVLRGVAPGKTLCSVDTGFGRQVYEVLVTAASSP